VDWPSELLARAEGLPLKNLTVSAGQESVSGELLITHHGLEGGAIYRLGRTLRAMTEPQVTIDFKPQLTEETMQERTEDLPSNSDWFRAWKLSAAALALLETMPAKEPPNREQMIGRVKRFTIPLRGPRPIAEAISSAGGVPWSALDETLMLRQLPGVFVAGEMIDWEAPTGGYLLQGCFSTATRAGQSAALSRPR
jgi:predicted flavoprotein YhiN